MPQCQARHDIVEEVEKHCRTFYIRANRCGSLYDDIFALIGWKRQELGMLGKYIGDCDYSVIGVSGDDDTGGGDSLTTKNLKTNRTIIVTTFFIFLYYIYI